jgi:hypothetical protein
MKSKNAPQTRLQKILKLISIRPSVIVFALWFGLQIFEGMLDDPRIFYPLWVVIHSDWEFLLVGFIFIIIVLLDGFRLRRRQYHNTVVLSIVIQNTVFLLVMMLFTTDDPRLTHLQSLATDQHIYHLEQTMGSYDGRYNVSECDQTGLMCHYYANPFTSTPECFKEGGVLEQDSVTKALVLHIGPDTYPVDPAIPMYRHPLCYNWGRPTR